MIRERELLITGLSVAAGIGQSVLGGMASRQAAAAQNKAAKQSFRLESTSNQLNYSLGVLAAETQHEWDKARVEQLRSIEAQNAVDQATVNSKLIQQAAENYELNAEAMMDQFVTEEALRGTEAGMNLTYSRQKSVAETNNLIQQYLKVQGLNALTVDARTDKQLNDYAELSASLALDEKKDLLAYQIQQIKAVAESSQAAVRGAERQGSGNTAQRLRREAFTKLGRAWGELAVRSEDRDTKASLAARVIQDDLASMSAEQAIRSQDSQDRLAYAAQRGRTDQNFLTDQFERLLLPTFDLAQRNYTRQLQSLQGETRAAMDQPAYRQQQYMDPRAPIEGLGPVSVGPTKVQGQSTGSIIGSALMTGVNAAAKGAYKYNKTVKLKGRVKGISTSAQVTRTGFL